MAIAQHLENLRAKPEHIRKRYAFWSSLGVTAIIAAFWLGSIGSSLVGSSDSAVVAAVNKADSPTTSLVASVGTFFVDIKDILFGPKKVTYSSIEVSPGGK